jgi:hypothetical protein
MAKRFTSTEIWEEDWFLDMPIQYKLFWFYILSACNHAGIFRVNTKKFCGLNGVKVTSTKAIEYFNNGKQRIRILSESVWLIEDFFVFQYGEIFNPNNKVHESIEKAYNQANINLTSIRGLKALKERVKDKDKEKDKKGGAGENKETAKSFSEDGKYAVFDDGEMQKLSYAQESLLSMNELKPHQVEKQH